MSELSEFYAKIAQSIVDLEEDNAIEMAHEVINKNLNVLEAIEKGFAEGIRQVGDLYEEGEYYLPELMFAAKIMQDSLAIITPKLTELEDELKNHLKV